MKARYRSPEERGFALIEVLVGGVVVAVALTGLALMFAMGQSMVIAKGSERVQQYLAEEKLESIRDVFRNSTATSFPGLAAAKAGLQIDNPTAGQDGVETFTRVTNVYCVDKNNLSTPLSCTGGPTPSTLRVTVTVTRQVDQARGLDPDVILETVLVPAAFP